MTVPSSSVTVIGLPADQIDYAPAPVNNPPDPQVPASPSLQDQLNAVAQAQGINPNAPLTAEQQQIQDLYSKPLPVNDQPYSLQANIDALAAASNSSGEIVASPADVSNNSGYYNDAEFETDNSVASGPDGSISSSPADVSNNSGYYNDAEFETDNSVASGPDAQSVSQGLVQVGAGRAGNQPAVANLQFAPNTDWRVTLRLAPGATYLYNDPQAGLLQPLKVTNGVVFPYTPSITTAYKANYSPYDLTHSNYRGYFYQNSYTDAVNLTATFTAQSTADAAYVLAVIHFFRSVTKMFYGQSANRGSPPPLVFLSGLGDYQFNNHPCVVSQFNYVLPADVDYVSSGTPYNAGLNLQPLQNLYSTTLNAISPTVTRLATAFLPPGAQNSLPSPLQSLLSNPTYVPSKMDITLTLLPVQSRQQVSQVFDLQKFANGAQLKGGFW